MKRFLVLQLLSMVLLARADDWETFYPEHVIPGSLNYQVFAADVSAHGDKNTQMMYLCEVHARWDETMAPLVKFDRTEGYYPPTVSGRHQAEKACSKWIDEAGKRVAKAHEEARKAREQENKEALKKEQAR